MKRSHGTSSGGLHNPFGMAARQSQAQQHQPIPSASAPKASASAPQQGMAMPFSVPPLPPASAPPAPQYTNYGYAPQPVSYGMPAPYGYSAPYYPQQPSPMPVHPPPPPPPPHYPFSVPPPPPPPHAPQPVIGPSVGPPSKRVRYDQPQHQHGQPPPALPPLPQRPAFNPGPPPPPAPPQPSGKPPLPPQSLVRPNRNQPPKQKQPPPPSSSSNQTTSSNLPVNPKLPSKPSAAAAVALPAEGSMADTSKRGGSRDSTPVSFPQPQHQQQVKRQPSTRGGGGGAPGRGRGGSQRGGAAGGLSKRQSKKQKQLNNVSQHHHHQQQQPAPLSPVTSIAPGSATRGKEKEKDKATLTDFRILGLDLEVDGSHVWSWRGENASEQISSKDDKEKDVKTEDEGAASSGQSAIELPDKAPVSAAETSQPRGTEEGPDDAAPPPPPAETAAKTTDGPAAEAASEDKQDPLPLSSKHGRDEDEDDPAAPSQPNSAEPEEVSQPVEGRRKKLRAESPAWVPPLSPTAGSALGKPPPIPEQRENSRLRIYFGAASQHTKGSGLSPAPAHHSLKRKHPDLSMSSVSSPAKSQNDVDVDGDADENRHRKKAQNKVGEEEEEEEEEEDVDGTPVQIELHPSTQSGTEAEVEAEASAPADASDSSSKAVESQLVPAESTEDKTDTQSEEQASSKDAVKPSCTVTASSKPAVKPELSPDRLSISYAKNSRRILIDAECIEEVLIFRAEGRVECTISVQPASLEGDEGADPLRCCKGILVEAFDEDSKEFQLVDADALRKDRDAADPHLLPPFYELFDLSSDVTATDAPKLKASEMRLVARLDKANPFSEARWVRSGEADAHALQSAAQASSASKGGSSASAPPSDSLWRGKLHVVDPDSPPTFLELAHAWVDSHADGPRKDKMRAFVCSAFGDVNNIVELMLCLIRGGDLPPSRANPTSYRQPQVAELFARATALGAPQPNEQSSLSLATYAMFKLAIDNGVKAGLSQDELHREVCGIVRQLPSGMLHKAMDVQFRAWIAKWHCGGTS